MQWNSFSDINKLYRFLKRPSLSSYFKRGGRTEPKKKVENNKTRTKNFLTEFLSKVRKYCEKDLRNLFWLCVFFESYLWNTTNSGHETKISSKATKSGLFCLDKKSSEMGKSLKAMTFKFFNKNYVVLWVFKVSAKKLCFPINLGVFRMDWIEIIFENCHRSIFGAVFTSFWV